MIERRMFLGVIAGGLLAGPLAAEAQQADRVYRIGILGNVPLSDPGSARLWGAFADGLRDLGYVDGRNIRIEYLSSEGRYERLTVRPQEALGYRNSSKAAPSSSQPSPSHTY